MGSADGHFFSDDDQYVVYVTYDASDVPLMSWPYYGPKDDVYGSTVEIAYPKVCLINQIKSKPQVTQLISFNVCVRR